MTLFKMTENDTHTHMYTHTCAPTHMHTHFVGAQLIFLSYFQKIHLHFIKFLSLTAHNYEIYRCALLTLPSGPLRRGENVLITWVTKADRCNHYISAVCIKHSSELTELLRKTSSCLCIKYLEPNTQTQTRNASVSHTHLPQGISSKR